MHETTSALDLGGLDRCDHPLTPMQEGMLFHRLWVPGSGVDIEQIVCTLRDEPLDAQCLRGAFEWVMRQHAVLRTRFAWHGRERPVQIVEACARMPLEVLDWSDLTPGQRSDRLTQFLRADRGTDFDLSRAPAMRLACIRLGESEHAFVWSFHHILLDGRSFPLVLAEVFDAYDAMRTGQEPRAVARRPFSDFLAQFPRWEESLPHRPAEAYFRELLAGFCAVTPLEVGFVAREKLQLDTRSVSLQLEPGDTERLKVAALVHDVTPNTLFQAAWSLLLARSSGQSDVVFGTTRSCRRNARESFDDVIGLLINTLPMRAKTAPESTVDALLSCLRTQQLELRAHELTSLSDVQRVSDVPAGRPLFESIVVFDHGSIDHYMKQRGRRFARASFEYHGQTNFPLTLAGYLEPALLVRLEFDPTRFDLGTAERLLAQFVRILRTLCELPKGAQLREVPTLSETERRTLVDEFNRTDRAFPERLRLHDAFEAQVERAPEATALLCDDARLSYGELEARANRLAHLLVSRGAGPGQYVALCLPRSNELIVSMLAVLKSGAAYVPLDPAFPEDRLRFMLEDTSARLVVTCEALRERVPADGCEIVCLERAADELGTLPASRPPCRSTPDDVAYIIYTSGSTGRPKGVVVRHRPAINLIDWVNLTFQVGASDRLLFVTSPCFDLSVYDVFGVLAAGGSIRVATSDDLREPRRLVSLLRTGDITFWDSAPAALSQLVPFLPEQDTGSSLRLVFLSGDWIPVPLPDRVRLAFPGAELVSLGGATEATIWSNYYPIKAVDPRWPSIPYGRPIQNARYYVLDEHLQPLPVGVPGHLHIGGLCLADGYHARPELNAEKFIPNPFVPGERLYRTGDLARFMPDGELEFLGRIDLQVKVRGYRIELGEIEAVLNRHPKVTTSLVDAPRSTGAERMLVAYLVSKQEIDVAELRALCERALPEYMVPAHFIMLDRLPITPNGKVDRRALPSPQLTATSPYMAPRDTFESSVAEIFADCLGVERVGIRDSFFELGGHSLLAVRVIGEISARLERELPLASLMARPTVEAVCEALRKTPTREGSGTFRISPHPEAEPALSSGQERLVFIQRLDPSSAAYNIPLGFRIEGALDVAALERALAFIVQRHDPLRTAFAQGPRGEEARIVPSLSLELQKLDLSTFAEAERDAYLAGTIQTLSGTPFVLEQAPLMRALLVTLERTSHVLVFVVHHAVFDGTSSAILTRELLTLYDAFVECGANPLAPLPIRFNDYALARRTQEQQGAFDEDLAYFRGQLGGTLPILQLPLDRPRPRTLSYRGGVVPFELSRETSSALRRCAQAHDASAFTLLLSAFFALLHRYSGQNDVVVGIPVSGRDSPETEPLIGLFLNTLAVRAAIEPKAAFRDLLAQVKGRCLEALDHKRLPFERLVEALNPPRDTSITPIFQALFSYEETTGRAQRGKHLKLSHLLLDAGFARTDLSLFLHDSREHGIHGYLEYSSDLFDEATIRELAQGLGSLIEHAVRTPGQAVGALSVMSESERLRQITWDNDTDLEVDAQLTLVHRFEAQAALHPYELAVCHRETALSYAALAEQVRLMAEVLREQGAVPGRGVAVFLERSPRLPIVMLATLRLGAYYVPLDPSHPAERNGRILKLSAPVLVVAEAGTRTALPESFQGTVFDLDQSPQGSPRVPASSGVAPIATDPDGIAYVIFTSGSTGEPKGVEVSHRALTNFLCSMARRPGMGVGDHLVALTTVSFDIAALELFLPLTTGASLAIVDRSVALDGRALARALAHGPEALRQQGRSRPATHVQATPATYRLLLDAELPVLSGLKALCGGEPLPRDLRDALRPRVGSLWNMYGPTETTVWSSLDEVETADAVISIGRPIHNTQLYVLNELLEPVPRGTTGMLYIGGEGVARGYHGRPDLTDAAFVRDPFSGRPGARIYRTGDLARRLPDGRLECLGRSDFQVKIRGYRIELGEIEVALAQHPDVAQGVVHLVGSGHDAVIVAFVVPRAGALDLESLQRALRSRLPSYMLPSRIVLLEALPLTPNGKIDRKALRVPASEPANTPDVELADDIECRVAGIFEHLLQHEAVGRLDNFFELGGHSLLAVRLVRELNTEFRVELSIGQVFEGPTVVAIADAVRRGGGRGHASVLPLNRATGKPPLYFICGIHLYRWLARNVGAQQPCFGIYLPEEQRFFEPGPTMTCPVESLAASYVAAMRAHNPTGPYLLAGVSFGGLLAFEMARQLEREGVEVPLLVLIDTVLPSALIRNSRKWLTYQLGELHKLGLKGLLTRLRRRSQQLASGEASIPNQADTTSEAALQNIRLAAYIRAANAYERAPLQRYGGRALLIRADDWLPSCDLDPQLGWSRRIMGGLSVAQSRGDHLSVLTEPRTAQLIRQELERLQLHAPERASSESAAE